MDSLKAYRIVSPLVSVSLHAYFNFIPVIYYFTGGTVVVSLGKLPPCKEMSCRDKTVKPTTQFSRALVVTLARLIMCRGFKGCFTLVKYWQNGLFCVCMCVKANKTCAGTSCLSSRWSFSSGIVAKRYPRLRPRRSPSEWWRRARHKVCRTRAYQMIQSSLTAVQLTKHRACLAVPS